jgi:hypothetical protein
MDFPSPGLAVQGFSFSALSAQDSAKQLPAEPSAVAANLAAQYACRAAGLTFDPGLPQAASEYSGAAPAFDGCAAALIDLHLQIGERIADIAICQGLGFFEDFHMPIASSVVWLQEYHRISRTVSCD